MTKSFLDITENVGKGENASYQHFSPFYTMYNGFKILLFNGSLKLDCGTGSILYNTMPTSNHPGQEAF